MGPLHFDSTPQQIGSLQAALVSLGYSIDQEEITCQNASVTTIRAIRRFQREHLLPVDESFLVDQATASLLHELLSQRGLIHSAPQAGPRFFVEGVVKDRDGVPIPELEVVAYDQDLRSRQHLGASFTDGVGRYSIEYNTETFKRAAKGYADIVVEILPGRSGVGAAHQTLYTSEVIFNAPEQLLHEVDLPLCATPEFDRVAKAVRRLVGPENLGFHEIDETERFKDIGFLAGETGYSREQISDFAVAHRLAQVTPLDPSLLYALLRIDLWPDYSLPPSSRTYQLDTRATAILARFGMVSAPQLRGVLRRAEETNVVAVSDDRIEAFTAAFCKYAARVPGLRQYVGLSPTAFVALLEEASIPEPTVGDNDGQENCERPQIEARVAVHLAEATDGFDLVRRLREDESVSKSTIDRIEGVVHFSSLSLNYAPLTKALVSEIRSLDDVRRLGKRTNDEWSQILQRTLADEQLPAFAANGSAYDQRAAYAKVLAARFRQTFPTMAFVGDASRERGEILQGTEALARIVELVPAFELGEISIDRFFETPVMRERFHPEEREALAGSLKPLQRLYRVTKNYALAKALATAGINSAQDAYRHGEDTIIKIVTAHGQSRRAGEIIHAQANTIYAATLQITMEFAAFNSSNAIPALATPPNEASNKLPSLSGLFKIGNDCACNDWRSVVSPAAYLADILLFLKNRLLDPNDKDKSAKRVLLKRRPDLEWIDLNGDNANIQVPYIDICVEVLEDAIAPYVIKSLSAALRASLPSISGAPIQAEVATALATGAPSIAVSNSAKVSRKIDDSWVLRDADRTWRIMDRGVDLAVLVVRNTHGTVGEREVLPEYVNEAAYTAMSGKTFPWHLPLDLYGAEVRGTLEKIGVPRHELMRVLKGPAMPNNPSDLTIAAVQLGLSDAIANLLVTPNAAAAFMHWGAASNADAIARLSGVPVFLKATQLHYVDLLRLLTLPFPNPNGELKIAHLDESCDLDKKRIDGLDAAALDRLHRFLRLARSLGLPLADVDLLVRASTIGADLTAPAGLVGVAAALQVRDQLGGIAIDDLVTLFGDMPTIDVFQNMFEPRKSSLYARLFLDPAVFRPFDPAFAVDKVVAGNPLEQVVDHRGPILAALRLGAEDLERLLKLEKPASGRLYVDGALSIKNISALYRHITVARALGLSIEDWCTYVRIGATDPFLSPSTLLKTIDRVRLAMASPFEPATLSYVLAADRRTAAVVPTETQIATALDGLRSELQSIDAVTDPTNLSVDRTGLIAAIAPALLAVDSDPLRPPRVIAVLEGSYIARAVLSPAPPTLPQLGPRAKALPFNFATDGADLVLTYTGLMDLAHKTILTDSDQVGTVAANSDYREKINELFTEPRLAIRMFRTAFSTRLDLLPVGIVVPPPLRQRFRYDAAKKQLSFHGVMTSRERRQLLLLSKDMQYAAAVRKLFDAPRAELPAEDVWLSDQDLQFPSATETPWQRTDRITINLRTALTKLLPQTRKARSEDAVLSFAAGVTAIDRDATSSLLHGIKIRDKSLLEHLSDRAAFVTRTGPPNASEMQKAFQSYDLLHRSAQIASRMNLKLREIDFIITSAKVAGVLKFGDLPLSFQDAPSAPASLDPLLDLSELVVMDSRTLGKSERLLEFITTAASLAAKRPPYVGVDVVHQFADFTEAALGWPAITVRALVFSAGGIPGGIGIAIPDDVPASNTWRRLAAAIDVIRKICLPVTDVLTLTRTMPTSGDAALVRQAARARFGAVGFAGAMRPVQNVLRQLKRDALSAYLLTYQQPTVPPPPTGNWITAGDVFAYYLIDPEMNACQMTSRIVQACSTIQTFIHRAKMGLEPDMSPFIAKDSGWNQWNWMKAYRLWEANRKTFLFPENLLDPGLRANKSPAFKALEDELLQGDISDDSVRVAFLTYIDRLDEVSNLDITGIHWDDGGGEGTGSAYLVGRTPGQEPHAYYHRKLTHPEDRWTAWTKIELDLKNAPAVPFLYQKRLHLLWPEFREQKPDVPEHVDVPVKGGDKPVETKPPTFLYGVALSENRNGKWTPKKVSKAMHDGGTLSDVPKEKDKKEKVYWFPIDLLNAKERAYYFIDSFDGEKEAMEFLGCRGYPENSNNKLLVTKTKFKNATLIAARDVEAEVERDDELAVTANWAPSGMKILHHTPGTFRITYPHHVTSYDRFFSAGWQKICEAFRLPDINISRFHEVRAVTTGTRAPWVYGDKTRNFFVEPVWDGDGKQYNGSQLLDVTKAEFGQIDPSDPLWAVLLFNLAQTDISKLQLRWSLFYHPLVCEFRRTLLNGGIKALMARKTQFLSTTFKFKDVYEPYDEAVLSQHPKEDVDFSDRGAYSLYNWELFFHAPYLIAMQLSKSLRFEEAMKWFHFIFDPTGGDGVDPVTDDTLTANETRRFWITKPFFEHTDPDYISQRIDKILHLLASEPNDSSVNKEARKELERQVASWRKNPFDAHLIASARTVAYQKATLMSYIENLIAWGDTLFVDNAIENVLEAGSIYRYAKSILGDKPEVVPPLGEPPVRTFAEIGGQLDVFGNTLIHLEDLLPVLPMVGPPEHAARAPSVLNFCVPQNDKLLALWDLIDDRLDKFHRCLDLRGRPRGSSLFAPPVDPTQIMRALMGGAALADLLNDFEMPLSSYRFHTYLQKANELVSDLKSFGSTLLSSLEKRDGEALSRLRQSHEVKVLEVSREIKAALIRDAEVLLANLEIGQETATIRNRFYASREFMNIGESAAIGLTSESLRVQVAAMTADTLGGVLAAIPDFNAGVNGFGGTPHVTLKTGGLSFAKAMELAAKALAQSVGIIDKTAGMISTVAGYRRRFEDWQLQKDVTAKEIQQYASQIEGARIRIDNAKRELANHDLQIEHAKAIDEFLRMKYTNGELYQWMAGEISKAYFSTYKLAYAFAKMAEQHYRFEHGLDHSNIIRFDAWDSLKKGLISGERLQFDLRQLENAYLNENRRDFELTKHIALATAAPSALLALRRFGRCEIDLPEELFDLDYPGHYFRRIKSVSLSIPCVAGPNTTIACTLRLIRSSARVTTKLLPGANGYARKTQPLDDPRFREWLAPVSAIVTSSGQNDAGLFELNLRDERYLPFEGAGVVSRWSIELQTDDAPRTFNYDTIADVIMHFRYTAREDQGAFKKAAIENLKIQLKDVNGRLELHRIFRVPYEFAVAWSTFQNRAPGLARELTIELAKERFAQLTCGGTLKLQGLQFSGHTSTPTDLVLEIGAPPLTAVKEIPLANDKGYFATANLEKFGPIALVGGIEWKFRIRYVGGTYDQFDPKVIDDLYIIVAYTLE